MMFRKILSLTVMTAMLANLVIASLCHAHGDPSDPSSRPHIHIGNFHHTHGHEHGHTHRHHSDHGHPHHGDPSDAPLPGNENEARTPLTHDCDVIYFLNSKVVTSPTCGQVEITDAPKPLFSDTWAGYATLDYRFAQDKDSRRVLAHPLILKNIRMLL